MIVRIREFATITVPITHGEQIIEREFSKRANSGDTKKIGVVFDPRNELGESTPDDNEKFITATWQ
jgi:hypothetical protein